MNCCLKHEHGLHAIVVLSTVPRATNAHMPNYHRTRTKLVVWQRQRDGTHTRIDKCVAITAAEEKKNEKPFTVSAKARCEQRLHSHDTVTTIKLNLHSQKHAEAETKNKNETKNEKTTTTTTNRKEIISRTQRSVHTERV